MQTLNCKLQVPRGHRVSDRVTQQPSQDGRLSPEIKIQFADQDDAANTYMHNSCHRGWLRWGLRKLSAKFLRVGLQVYAWIWRHLFRRMLLDLFPSSKNHESIFFISFQKSILEDNLINKDNLEYILNSAKALHCRLRRCFSTLNGILCCSCIF